MATRSYIVKVGKFWRRFDVILPAATIIGSLVAVSYTFGMLSTERDLRATDTEMQRELRAKDVELFNKQLQPERELRAKDVELHNKQLQTERELRVKDAEISNEQIQKERELHELSRQLTDVKLQLFQESAVHEDVSVLR